MGQVDHNDAEGVVLEAGGQLFTVNRCRLVQASVMFRDMFDICLDDTAGKREGTEENPIPTGDDANSFRDFLWAVRVRPAELTQFLKSPSSPEKATKLINIARLSHKYQDTALSDWALEQLHETLTPTPAAFPFRDRLLKPLLFTLVLFKDDHQWAQAVIALLRQRVEESMGASVPDGINFVILVQACTASGCMSLLPTAYYALLVSPTHTQWLKDERLTDLNKRQLLHGAYQLTEAWHSLQMQCPAAYARHVMVKQRLFRPPDLLGKLKAISSARFTAQSNGYGALQYVDATTITTLSTPEHNLGRAWVENNVEEMLKKFPDNLADYFGVTASSNP